MEVNKKQLADIFGASIRTIQNWQEQGMPVLRGGGKGIRPGVWQTGRRTGKTPQRRTGERGG